MSTELEMASPSGTIQSTPKILKHSIHSSQTLLVIEVSPKLSVRESLVTRELYVPQTINLDETLLRWMFHTSGSSDKHPSVLIEARHGHLMQKYVSESTLTSPMCWHD